MPRRAALVALCAALAGCQDYRFNPVGRCLYQPGQERIPLAAISTADILFVVDDSGSMEPMQAALASNFGEFIRTLAATQQDRLARGLEPLDFHVAVTTSAVFQNRNSSATCGGSPLACNISAPTFPPAYGYPCLASGAVCGDLVDRYFLVASGTAAGTCVAGVAPGDGSPFPAGDFVAVGTNPRVLHFTKNLAWASWQTDPAIQGLIAQFQQNVQVGSCGSNQEQHFEASRLSVQKAVEGRQTVPAAEWPHPSSKLVVVWVGNEDDCSNPKDPTQAIVYSGQPGADACTTEQGKPLASQRLLPVADYAGYFTGLGRPFGAAFIYPGTPGSSPFLPGPCSFSCSAPGGVCQGYGPGARFRGLADGFRDKGVDVVEASICGDFGPPLSQIADLVKPPEGLELPTRPAAGTLIRLRIAAAEDDRTVKVCTGPALGQGWWFVDCGTGQATPGTPAGSLPPDDQQPRTCIAIDKALCQASPGQTYVAEYLGRVPEGGCTVPGTPSQQCADALQQPDAAASWTCDVPPGQTTGSCLCVAP